MATIKKVLKDKNGNNIIPAGLLDFIHPVGSIYMSATLSTAAQVQNIFGGTWVAWGSGRVPVGVDTGQTEFNSVGKTGGEKTHKLVVNEMPSHTHSTGKSDYIWCGEGSVAGNWLRWGTGDGNVQSEGGNAPHNNLQPYITCYMYKRTA